MVTGKQSLHLSQPTNIFSNFFPPCHVEERVWESSQVQVSSQRRSTQHILLFIKQQALYLSFPLLLALWLSLCYFLFFRFAVRVSVGNMDNFPVCFALSSAPGFLHVSVSQGLFPQGPFPQGGRYIFAPTVVPPLCSVHCFQAALIYKPME